MEKLIMTYAAPAEDSYTGWETESLPIGNGFIGVNVFGGITDERLQITENSLQNWQEAGGLSSFGDIRIHFEHGNAENYVRGLDLNNAVAFVKYDCGGVHYEREYFTSHPDRVLACRITADKKGALAFKVTPDIAYIKKYSKEVFERTKDMALAEKCGREGKKTVNKDEIKLVGRMVYYNLRFAGVLTLKTDGKTTHDTEGYTVSGATYAEIYFALTTNYELTSRAFTEKDPQKKLRDFDPMPNTEKIIKSVNGKSYDEIRRRHTDDYSALFGRVDLSLCGGKPTGHTDEMLKRYGDGTDEPYLEMLYYQYGRYLLISSSRPDTLPANLQGIWTCYDWSPWGAGYWHNINVQMNYWPAFNTDLGECFEAYRNFNFALRPEAERIATSYIERKNPENADPTPGECGWTIGTASYPYLIAAPGGHSGPGTGGLTTKLFWDQYDFTQDKDILKNSTYPTLMSMSKFLTKTVRNYDGKWLTSFSASPEQIVQGPYVANPCYYQTVGCSFDQQMIYENGKDFLQAADILGEDNAAVKVQREQIDKYRPILVGLSGQIKEYEEEKMYGEVGEYFHRHISQLVALYPGTQIGSETPALTDAAKITLDCRGDDSTGWALAHRLCAWSRTGDGDRSYKLFRALLGKRTLKNLWDFHPPFQIDGNFGGTAGVTEMLLQSHEGFINILPSLPQKWNSGSVKGLVARGNFKVDIDWENGSAKRIVITSRAGETCTVKYPKIGTPGVKVKLAGKATLDPTVIAENKISFPTNKGESYEITGIPELVYIAAPENFKADRDTLTLTWDARDGVKYNLYRATDNDSVYTAVAKGITGGEFRDNFNFAAAEHATYRLTACDGDGNESMGVNAVINHITKLEYDRYVLKVLQLNKDFNSLDWDERLCKKFNMVNDPDVFW